jgi:hypothetical protein
VFNVATKLGHLPYRFRALVMKGVEEGEVWAYVRWGKQYKPMPVAARSKAWVYGRPRAGIPGSHPAGGMECLFLVSVVCCQVEVSTTVRSLV